MTHDFIAYLNDFTYSFIPLSIPLNFLIFIGLIYYNRKNIAVFLCSIKHRTWLLLTGIFLAALLLRLFLPYPQHAIYTDEQIYMGAAKNMLLTGQQGVYFKSIGWPFILSIAFFFFGINNWVAIYTSVLLGALSVVPFFLLCYGLFKDENKSLIAAGIFALMPVHIGWSATAETNVASLFFILLAVSFSILYFRQKKYPLFLLALSGLSFAAHFRPENYIFFIIFFLGLFIFKNTAEKRIILSRITALLIFTVIILPNSIAVCNFYLPTDWIASDTKGLKSGDNWSFGNLVDNTKNFYFGFNGDALRIITDKPQRLYLLFSGIIFYLSVIYGVTVLITIKRKETLFLLFWWLSLYAIYFSSWLQTLGSRSRFYMGFYPVTIIFSLYGFISLYRYLSTFSSRRFLRRFAPGLMTVVVFIMFLPSLIGARGLHANPAKRLETKVPELIERDLSKNCLVLCALPEILTSTTNLNVLRLADFLNISNTRREALMKVYRVIFFEDFYALSFFPHEIIKLRDIFRLVIIREYREQSEKIHLYELRENNLISLDDAD